MYMDGLLPYYMHILRTFIVRDFSSIMIQGIFYARFFPQKGKPHSFPVSSDHVLNHQSQPRPGPKIVAQSPPGCITASETTTTTTARQPLVDFDVLHEYIIPRQAFCNRYVTINSPDDKYTVLGFPVVIAHAKYQRNEFIFNFGLLIEADVDQTPYEGVVRYLAATFSEMEKQNEYLSQGDGDGDGDGVRDHVTSRRPIESLLEIVKEDLNNYGECMIPVGTFLLPAISPFLLQ